jgi:hypothetical protein
MIASGRWLPFAALLAAAPAGGGTQVPSPAAQVHVFERGTSRTLSGAAAGAVALAVEQMFTGADDRPRLIISPDRLDDIKSHEAAIEVVYGKPKLLTVLKQSLETYQVLVPLSGELSGGFVMYAAPSPDGGQAMYSAGNVVRNSRGLPALRQVLRSNGVDIK